MKTHIICISLLFGIFSFAGCASAPDITTRSYALVNPKTETALIHQITTTDEVSRLGIDKFQKIISESGGKYTVVEEISDENTVIVTTTSHAHAAISKALDESRKDMKAATDN